VFGQPPEAVPDGLTADQYYELALWYEETRALGSARKALHQALAVQPDGPTAVECKQLLNTRIPTSDPPKEAIDKFRRAEAQLHLHPEDGVKTAEKLADEYPEFDWPHRLLAEYHLQRGDVPKCIQSLHTALRLHPDWPAAQQLMVRTLLADMEYEAARSYLQNALLQTPNDDQLRSLSRSLEYLVAMDEEGNQAIQKVNSR